MPNKNGAQKYQFLAKLALQKGATDAKIIPTTKVVVEDRVVLKCKVGCKQYGKTLAPMAPQAATAPPARPGINPAVPQ